MDKWDKTKKENIGILINECATAYALKKMIYPNIFSIVLKLAYYRRCSMYLKDKDSKLKANKHVKDIVKEYHGLKKIKIKTVIKEYKKFGIAVF